MGTKAFVRVLAKGTTGSSKTKYNNNNKHFKKTNN
jgi:hypothetical protein|tara:strand:- start:4 stop:108 length:105 start_codon:yes stop_codon:yes gene_type:complete